MAGLVILGIEKIKSYKIVSIDIEGAVDHTPFNTSVSDSYRGRVTEENMRISLAHSLDQLGIELLSEPKEPGGRGQEDVSNSKNAVLEESRGGDCSESASKVPGETYFRRGKALVALNNYKPAMVCLMRAQEEERDTQVYRDSCSEIAMMYELGWGVEKNIETAKVWLKKANE